MWPAGFGDGGELFGAGSQVRAAFIIRFRLYLAFGLCVWGWIAYVFFTEARGRWKWLASALVVASSVALFAGPLAVLGWVGVIQVVLAGALFFLAAREE